MRTKRNTRTVRGIIGGVVAAAIMLVGLPAHAADDPPPPDLVMTGTGAGLSVNGWLVPAGEDRDPLAGYPADNPAGYERNSGFAGIIKARAALTGETLDMYCIDLRTPTNPGMGYEHGTWDEANVPYTGYVARILAGYYPNTGAPLDAPGNNTRAAAVQAAIWFFSDGYVLDIGSPVRPYTEAVVADALDAGPLAPPNAPDLMLTPASAAGRVDQPVGPFTVIGDSAHEITVTATGATMYRDAAGIDEIADGATVPSRTDIWLRATGDANATITARGIATVPGGNAYVYTGNVNGVDAGQKLILSRNANLAATAVATAEFTAVGMLRIDKNILGDAAGGHDEIVLHVSASDGYEQDIRIPAGVTGQVQTVIGPFAVGTVVTVTEPQNGANATVTVETEGLGEVVIQRGENSITIDNAYEPVPTVDPDPEPEPEQPAPVDPVDPVTPTDPPQSGGLAATGLDAATVVIPTAIALTLIAGGLASALWIRRNRTD